MNLSLSNSFAPLKNPATYSYRILTNSILKINGKTNINEFSCDCRDRFNEGFFQLKSSKNKQSYIFENIHLCINIQSLDCGNSLINKDLQKALNAKKYPYIEISLLEVFIGSKNPNTVLKDWIPVKAKSEVKINGCSNKYWLNAKEQKTAPGHFHFLSSKTLHMSDFGIVPPTAFFGMIEVQNEIMIEMDLKVKTSPAKTQ